jgi:predicted SAM-dependent methyltransferase
VYDLNKRIKQLKRILKKNGTLFIAVPNQGSWDARYYKTFWDGYDVPRHIHHFSKKSFLHLIDKNNLMLVDIKPMYFDAPYVCMRSEQHQQHAFSFIKGAFFGMISTFSALFNGEYSSLMFIVKNK